MTFLVKIWFFDLSFGSLISFVIGASIGVTLCFLVYAIMILSSMRKTTYVVKSKQVVTDAEVNEIIHMTQAAFKDKNMRKDDKPIAYCYNLCQDLVKDIATKFFPDSKRPIMELSIDEMLMLSHYVSNRLDEVLDHRGIRLFRKVKLSSIFKAQDIKKSIDDNPIVKATKKYKIAETFKAASKVINLINPVFWVKKVVVSSLMGAVTNKLCLIVIAIVGEETFKIYSKSVFNEDVVIDSGIEDLVGDLDKDIKTNLSESTNDIIADANDNIDIVTGKKKKKGEQ